LHVADSKSSFMKLRNELERRWVTRKNGRPDRREYTLMYLPHNGKHVVSLRIPISILKYSAAVLGVLLVMAIGAFVSCHHTVYVATVEKDELERLRQVNATQSIRFEQLAKATASMQEDMTRFNRLDADLRRMVNREKIPAVSRSGVVRVPGYSGQGDPIVKQQAADLINLVQELQVAAKSREQSLTALREALTERTARLSATPSILPAGGDVTSRFGWRSDPWGGRGSDWHPGIDIANDYGTLIVATADGEVVFSGWYGGYGKMIQINHGNGVSTVYGHCAETLVNAGDKVKKGGSIAYMGSTGYSTGTHVHYEVRVNGTAVNPANFL